MMLCAHSQTKNETCIFSKRNICFAAKMKYVYRGFQELLRLLIGIRIILRGQQLTTCGHSSANNFTMLVYEKLGVVIS